ncbi:hypothetical protein SCHPADRAFT_911993 [Schizopora paradoxa]|uniref:Uncharacterized protein n=1 Tax=Schizopora paradoxa TaxID=27342 RepID=A0A0H2QXP2_9AGAM|nr:hypothetical protein SCHPADRAFT_911993 [Schizopora paradoxa]
MRAGRSRISRQHSPTFKASTGRIERARARLHSRRLYPCVLPPMRLPLTSHNSPAPRLPPFTTIPSERPSDASMGRIESARAALRRPRIAIPWSTPPPFEVRARTL